MYTYFTFDTHNFRIQQSWKGWFSVPYLAHGPPVDQRVLLTSFCSDQQNQQQNQQQCLLIVSSLIPGRGKKNRHPKGPRLVLMQINDSGR